MDEKRITPVAKLTRAPTSPMLEELFCVVCAILTETGETKPFCSKTCEDMWNAYDTGRMDWAVFYELSLT